MAVELVIRITPEGVKSIEPLASTEQEEKEASALLERIRPCIDVADAIVKRTSAGPRG